MPSQLSIRGVPAAGAAILALGLAGPATAVVDADFRFDTTKDLVSICAVPESAPEYPVARQACRAFIEATAEYHDAVSKRNKLKRLFCLPANTTIEDAVAVFTTWGAAKAADAKVMAEPPVIGVVRALASKNPCKD